MQMRFFIVLFLAFSLGLPIVQAEEVLAGSQFDPAKEQEIAVRAKKRLYPGGRDEGDLKVQAQIITPARKLSPQAEVKEESEDE